MISYQQRRADGCCSITLAWRNLPRTIHLSDILAGNVELCALFEIVMVGATASGICDIHSTCLTRVYPGAQIHTTSIGLKT
jgi:CHASE2 domain-containing sensor protein